MFYEGRVRCLFQRSSERFQGVGQATIFPCIPTTWGELTTMPKKGIEVVAVEVELYEHASGFLKVMEIRGYWHPVTD